MAIGLQVDGRGPVSQQAGVFIVWALNCSEGCGSSEGWDSVRRLE